MTRRLAAAALGTLTLAAGLLGAPAALHTAAPSLQQQLDRAGTDLPFDPLLASVSCPVERGLVKEGADPDRFKVSSAVVSTSIAGLRAKPKPSVYPQRNRIAPVELHVYQVAATLTQYKQESDGDIHLVLKDSAGRSMIAEIPYGACASASRWRSQIASTRSAFAARYPVSTSWHYVRRAVVVRGLGMFDPPHRQTGAAPNGIELHPVIGITFR